MGSTGKQEVCPYSDLEYMILIQNESARYYFKKLAQIFEIQVASLGEIGDNPTDNLVFSGIHVKNPIGFQIDVGPAKHDQDLIRTPQSMARLQYNPVDSPQVYENTVLKTKSLHAHGNTLFNQYKEALVKPLNEYWGFEYLKNLSSLSELKLIINKNESKEISPESCKYISMLPALKSLKSKKGTFIADNLWALTKLTALQELSLEVSYFANCHINFSTFTNLKILKLHEENLTETKLEFKIFKGLSNLTSLHLKNLDLSSKAHEIFSSLNLKIIKKRKS